MTFAQKKVRLFKITALLYSTITVLGVVAFFIFDRFRETPMLITLGKIAILVLTILSIPLFIGLGVFCLWKAYCIVRKPMSGYQEEPGMLGDSGGIGPSRKLGKSYDIIADKVWNGVMYGFLGVLMVFSGAMILRYLVEGFITMVRWGV